MILFVYGGSHAMECFIYNNKTVLSVRFLAYRSAPICMIAVLRFRNSSSSQKQYKFLKHAECTRAALFDESRCTCEKNIFGSYSFSVHSFCTSVHSY